MLVLQMQNLSFKDFYQPTPYNQDTKNQIWMSQLADSHDNICNCKHPFAHLLASIFPPGHKDRDLTINQILARDYREKCLSGGDEERETGMARDGCLDAAIKEEGYIEDAELDQLIELGESAAAAEER